MDNPSISQMSKQETAKGPASPPDPKLLRDALSFATRGLPADPSELEAEALAGLSGEASAEQVFEALIDAALRRLSPEVPHWDSVAARLYLYQLYEQARKTRGLMQVGYLDYPALVRRLVGEGQYDRALLESYGEEGLAEAARWIDPARDLLFSYAGIRLFAERYLVRTSEGLVAELPQEAFLGVALTLARAEAPSERLSWAHRFYDALSKLDITLATPMLRNARRPQGQLSSCFVDVVPDSLEGIYHSLTTFARVSKNGGGMGVYLGKIRSTGAPIRGVPGVAKGVLPWVRLFNDTAVAVDQLGQRAGAVTLWLDVWHPDVFEFLELRTPQGDERRKARDVFTGLCIPDAFMEAVEADGPWHLFDPYEVEKHMGFRLEDSWGQEWRRRYAACVKDERLPRKTIRARELWRQILQAIYRSGMPFLFFRDRANELNPNAHAGMVYCSNLCTEIIQNVGESEPEPPFEEGGLVVQRTRPGDLVVCNLASINLAHVRSPQDIDRLVPLAVRMLDDSIEVNTLPVPEANRTNRAYRAIGVGVHGYHQYLLARGIAWESELHLKEADALFERIAYRAIEASCALAGERGPYPLFAGSDWQTGAYFRKRGYKGEAWERLAGKVAAQGLRNGYLLAVAPTSSTSIIADTTPGIDPVFELFWREDKRGYSVWRIAPGLRGFDPATVETAHRVDQIWSIRAAAARQRHIDQSQSLNLYRTPGLDAKRLSQWYFEAWRLGLKTVYYFRNFQPEEEWTPPKPTTSVFLREGDGPAMCLGCEL